MKLSSSTQAGPHSVRVHTLDGSKDVWGARREPKGRLGLNILQLVVPNCAALGEPMKCGPELYQR